ncbi:olfactory receptor 56A4-like [Lissotriton helveticus]
MALTNSSFSEASGFELICFAGLGSWKHWLSIPLAFLFLISLVANTALLLTIYATPTLHQPMYHFLCLLAKVDLLLSVSIGPRTLAVLWFDASIITPVACFSQMYFIYFGQGMEASIFLVLGYDRYVAICNPLRYTTIITDRRGAQTAAAMLAYCTAIYLPYPFLVARLRYCERPVVPHCFCENIALAEIACSPTAANNFYSLAVLIFVVSTLTLSLVFSYSKIIRAVMRLGSWEASRKAFGTCSAHLMVVGFIYSILTITTVSNRAGKFIPRHVHVMLAVLRYLAPTAMNPIVYGIRTREIYQALRSLMMKHICGC